MRFAETEVIAIDDWIAANAPGMSRPDAVRQMTMESMTQAVRPKMTRVLVIERTARQPGLPKANAD